MKFSAIILAAGTSQRFGGANKLLSPFKGARLLDHCFNTVLASPFDDRILVTGHERSKIEPIVKNLPIRPIYNPDFAAGMGTSLATGAQALKPDCDAFMVFLGDMPEISATLVNRLQSVFIENAKSHSIVRPTYRGKPGHPVLFGARHVNEISALTADDGAQSILSKHPGLLRNIPVQHAGCIYDIDKYSPGF